ncbi:MAG: hypothetical protein QM758_17950 [Armatimonas sp.]
MSTPAAITVERHFRRLGQRKDLWPGFEPLRIPAAIYDEAVGQTFLFRHPAPPAGFQPVAGEAQTVSAPGRYDGITANTSGNISGLGTALMILPKGTEGTPARGAVLVHEAFHVFQREKYPKWAANEADLFVYPFEDMAALTLRVRETRALKYALKSSPTHAAEVVALRQARFARLALPFIAYERLTELNEGLAQYVEGRTGAGRRPRLPEGDFPAETVRQRAYETGQALGMILDRLDPRWREALSAGEAGSMDELLALALKRHNIPLPDIKTDAGAERAALELKTRWEVEQRKARAAFDAREGWRVELICSSPLFPQGFDPLNVLRLGKDVLHSRFVKLGNDKSTLETMNVPALTTAAGEHPLFSGVSKVVVAGLSERPRADQGERSILILTAPGLQARLASPEIKQADTSRTLRLVL